MKIRDIICEAEASDEELTARWGQWRPEDRDWLPNTKTSLEPAATLWSAMDVLRDILGSNNVTDDEDALKPGMYYAYESNEPPMFRDTGDGVGSINLPNLDSTAAGDVAIAAHEASHALVHRKSQGGAVHVNEKIVNNLAERWLRKHLRGPQLHAALERIVGSRLNYGRDYLPKMDKR